MELRPHEIEAIRLAQEYDKINKMDEVRKLIYDRQGFRPTIGKAPCPTDVIVLGNGCYQKQKHLHS